MYFEVRHEIRYAFSEPVHLGRHTLRLRPISDAEQRVHRFEMSVSPEPAGTGDLSDLDGNYATAMWWEDPTRELAIRAKSIVETMHRPSGFRWQGDATLPLKYPSAFSEALGAYRASVVPQPVRELAEAVAESAGGDAQAFPAELARIVHERIPRVIRRDSEEVQDAGVTLARSEGTCRDLAVLLMAMARAQGFAARFVSGYIAAPGSDDEHDLHAWAELYLPGGGWRGFDPTTGSAVGERHIAVAASALAEQAVPVSGAYTGHATRKLDTWVSVTEVPSLV